MNKPKFITVITDCYDSNTVARQETRWSGFLDTSATVVGVDNFNEYEAGAHLIDVLDASEGERGIVFVNVAPRHGKGKKWPNGTPFGYFYYQETLVISSIDGFSLSLVKKLGLTDSIKLWDIPTVVDDLIENKHLKPRLRDHIVKSQFRSYEFVPRAARFLWEGIDMPTTDYSLDQVEDIPAVVTFCDNFGNCPTSILPEEINFQPGKEIETKLGKLTCYDRLKDVPGGEKALIIGSWGIEGKRFVAVVYQGKSAQKLLNLECGTQVI